MTKPAGSPFDSSWFALLVMLPLCSVAGEPEMQPANLRPALPQQESSRRKRFGFFAPTLASYLVVSCNLMGAQLNPEPQREISLCFLMIDACVGGRRATSFSTDI